MECFEKDFFVLIVHQITLIQRFCVFRPRPGATVDPVRTQMLFSTNEFLHDLASHWQERAESLPGKHENWQAQMELFSKRLNTTDRWILESQYREVFKTIASMNKVFANANKQQSAPR